MESQKQREREREKDTMKKKKNDVHKQNKTYTTNGECVCMKENDR